MSTDSNVYAFRSTSPQSLPEPLLPFDVDLTGFHYLPVAPDKVMSAVDWRRAKREPFYAYRFLALFFAAFRQTPSGSLPDDDQTLADVVGVDDATWAAIKADTMREWTLCDDGRWHHPIVAGSISEAWAKHRGNKARPEKATAARAAKRAEQRDVERDVGCDDERDARKGEEMKGEETKRKKVDSKHSRPPAGDRDAFDRFWVAYPAKVGKGAAEKSHAKAMREVDGDESVILSGVERYKANKPKDQAWCHAATYLNQRRWEDEPEATVVAATEADDPMGSVSERGDYLGNLSWMRRSAYEARYGKFNKVMVWEKGERPAPPKPEDFGEIRGIGGKVLRADYPNHEWDTDGFGHRRSSPPGTEAGRHLAAAIKSGKLPAEAA